MNDKRKEREEKRKEVNDFITEQISVLQDMKRLPFKTIKQEIITINVPVQLINIIKIGMDKGYIISRSNFIRNILIDGIPEKLRYFRMLENYIEGKDEVAEEKEETTIYTLKNGGTVNV